MYMPDHIFLVLPIKDLINKDDDPTTPHKLATGTNPSVSHLHVLFCPCVVRKATAHIEKITHVNETLKVSYLLPVCVALLDLHPRL